MLKLKSHIGYQDCTEKHIGKYPNGNIYYKDIDKLAKLPKIIIDWDCDLNELPFIASFVRWFQVNNTSTEIELNITNLLYNQTDRNYHYETKPLLNHVIDIIDFQLCEFEHLTIWFSDPHNKAIIEELKKRSKCKIMYKYPCLDSISNSFDISECENLIIIFPDMGARIRYQHACYSRFTMRNELIKYITLNKTRTDDGIISEFIGIDKLPDEKNEYKFVIVDDVCVFGGTYVSVIQCLKEKYKHEKNEFFLSVSHKDFERCNLELNPYILKNCQIL